MYAKKIMPITFLIIVIFLSVLFIAWLNPPVTIFLNFDPNTQIVSTSLKNESAGILHFDGSPARRLKDIPRNVYVKILAKDGKVLSKFGENDGGYINGRADMEFQLRPIPLQNMSTLAPHETITSQATLKDLLGGPLYPDLLKLQDFCVQFKVYFDFNPYGLFTVTKETQKFCMENVIYSKK